MTICTKDRQCILSRVVENLPDKSVGADIIRPPKIELSKYGDIIYKAIQNIPSIYTGVLVDRFVIMPNHVHILLRIENNSGRMISAPTVIGSMKRYASKEIGYSIWQKGFYDHIIRNEHDYTEHLQYIDQNPTKWLLGKDEYYC
ncbi:MAG: transposase [Clostridia bacterium]|nr:transposase [Clostridia bacterium]